MSDHRDLPARDAAFRPDLGALWREARGFGRPSILTSSLSGKVWAKIDFDTLPGTELRAESERHTEPEDALAEAIERARQIRAAFK